MNQYELALVVSAKVEDDVKAATLEKAQKYTYTSSSCRYLIAPD